jgi:hypothetical protein
VCVFREVIGSTAVCLPKARPIRFANAEPFSPAARSSSAVFGKPALPPALRLRLRVRRSIASEGTVDQASAVSIRRFLFRVYLRPFYFRPLASDVQQIEIGPTRSLLGCGVQPMNTPSSSHVPENLLRKFTNFRRRHDDNVIATHAG